MGDAVDYSFSRPAPWDLVNAGYEVALRYLGRDSRCITTAELRRLHEAGLKVGLIGQTTISRPRGGYGAGVEDANKYNNLADELGAPHWIPIFYVIDVGSGFPATSDYPAIREYVRGILDTSRRPFVGLYGPYPVLEMLRGFESHGRQINCWWQTAGGSGSGAGTGGAIRTGDGSYRRLSSLACMFQHYGMTGVFGNQIDHNTVLMRPVTWAWHPTDDAPPTNPVESPEEDEEEMLTIYWTRPPDPERTDDPEGSRWVQEVAGLDNSIGHGFAVEGRVATYIGELARFDHEGWDERTTAVRNIIDLQGAGKGFTHADREARDVHDSVFRGLCLLPPVVPSALDPVDVDVDEAAIVAGVLPTLVEKLTEVVRTEGVEIGIDIPALDELDARIRAAGLALHGQP